MVDSIKAHQNTTLHELPIEPSQSQQIGRIPGGPATEGSKANVLPLFGEKVDISNEALDRLAAERQAFQYASLAARQEEPFDSDKVAHFKAMLDSGRINDYLRSVGNDALADSLLNNPIGALFK